jgi:hypothetical protein
MECGMVKKEKALGLLMSQSRIDLSRAITTITPKRGFYAGKVRCVNVLTSRPLAVHFDPPPSTISHQERRRQL